MSEDCYNLLQVVSMLTTTRMTLREWLRDAHIIPAQNLGNKKERMLTRAQVERLAELHGRTLPSEQPAAPADPLAALESRLRTLEQRIAALETPPAVHAPVAHSQPQQPAVPAQPAVLYPLAQRDVQKTLARPKHKAFTVAWRAREWLALHGVSPRSMEGWQDMPLETYAAVLDYAQAQGARLGRCGDDACPCRDLLD